MVDVCCATLEPVKVDLRLWWEGGGEVSYKVYRYKIDRLLAHAG